MRTSQLETLKRLLVGSSVLVVLLAGGGDALFAADCRSLEVDSIDGKVDTDGDSDSDSGARRRAGMFYATEVIDLQFRVFLRDSAASLGLLRLEVLTPREHLYQTLTVPYRSDVIRGRGGARPTVRVDGYPKPMPVQTTRKKPSGDKMWRTVEVRFPVAGTSIVHGSLYGTWEVVPYLDDDEKPCGPGARFELRDAPRKPGR